MRYTACEEFLGPGDVLCTPRHCELNRQRPTMRAICDCLDWKGRRIPDCEPRRESHPVMITECYNRRTGESRTLHPDECHDLHRRDPDWSLRECFCCCCPHPSGARVETGEGGERPAREVAPGDTVAGGTARMVDGVLRLSWSPLPVWLSEGTPAVPGLAAVRVCYGDGGELAVAADQPFLTPGGTLVRADRLRPGDRLVDPRGRPVPVTAVEAGRPAAGLHHLATGLLMGPGTDGHLLALNGVVAADHAVRLLQAHPCCAPAASA